MPSTPLLRSLPGPLWLGVVARDKDPIYGWIELMTYITWIVWVNWIADKKKQKNYQDKDKKSAINKKLILRLNLISKWSN